MTDYKKQLERLKRHYKRSLEHYDSISFLDLVHTLRVWTEIKDGIDKIHGKPTFKKSVRTKSLRKILRGSEYAYAYLPDGVTTSAVATGEMDGRNIFSGPKIEKFSAGGLVKMEKNHDLTLYQFLLIYRVLSPEEIKLLDKESKSVPIKKVSFSKYMESSAIHFQFSDHKPRNISNEELIKRIANEYEASHADLTDTNFKLNNVLSEPVKRLMEYRCAQCPLPYFILLHIAGTIIDNLDGQF
jgi:hypothetical protein